MTLHPAELRAGRARQVVIIGGGLSGAAVAYHLAKATPADRVEITVVEPREALGQGVAYGTPDPEHRINVPHSKMTLDTAEPDHFARWLTSAKGPKLAPESYLANGAIYPPRAAFGAYVAAHLQPYLARGQIRHLKTRALAASRDGAGFRLHLEDGQSVKADQLVLAASHPAPSLPAAFNALRGSPALIADPYAPDALGAIGPDEAVLVVGAGLTGADVVASLTRHGHRGRLYLLSRHGRRSQPHGPEQAENTTDFSKDPALTALGLLRRIRAEVARETALGRTWHPLFDRIRQQGPLIWAALPLQERRRLLRHLRGLWDIHRFRIAPQTHASLMAAETGGQLQAYAGQVTKLEVSGSQINIALNLRRGGVAAFAVDKVVLATGPAHGSVTRSNPLYADLAQQGLIAADALRLGLTATAEGQAVDAQGRAQPHLFIAGPLARAVVGELMGVPEVTAWAEKIAHHLAEAIPAEV